MASIESIHALILDLTALVIENNKTVLDLNARIDTLYASQTRTRTISTVPDNERCTQTLVSGKNKGGQCSKKATVGSLCTIHNKKLTLPPVYSALSDEFVSDDILEEENVLFGPITTPMAH
jgi:hypothetical protein